MPINKTMLYMISGFFSVSGSSLYAAMDNQVEVGLIEEWIDNVYYTSENRLEDLASRLYVDAELNRTGEATNFDLAYRITHESYVQNSYESDVYLDGSGNLNVNLLPGKLVWNSNISSSITSRESLEPDRPDNRDQRNYLATSLKYGVLGSRVNSVVADVNASATRFREAKDNSSDRVGLGLNWDHTFSTITDGGIGCSADDVDFIETDDRYKTIRCMVNATRQIRNGLIDGGLGRRVINPEVGENLKGLSYSLNMTWSDANSRYKLVSYRDLTDTSIGLNDQDFVGGGSNPIDTNTDTLSLTVRKRIEFSYGYIWSQVSSVDLVIYRDSDDLYDSQLDTDREGLDLQYNRKLGDRLEAELSYSFLRNEYAFSTPFESVQYIKTYAFQLSKRFSEHLNVAAKLYAETRDAETNDQNYEVYSFLLNAAYTF